MECFREEDFSKNSFDLMRYWAAICIMLAHFAWQYGIYVSESNTAINAIKSITTFFPGVVIFFSISGFLIAASYERSKSRKDFFVKRVARMYPELWICTLVNLIVVCVLAYNLLDKSIITWLLTQVVGIANTPSCLDTFATGSINGALWTIFTEIQLYVVLGVTYNVLKKLSTKKWIVLLVFLAVCNVACDYAADAFGGAIAKLIERFFLTYAIWFFIGVFCYVKREAVIPALKKVIIPLLALYVVVKFVPVSIPGYYSNIAAGILCPFIVVGGGIAYLRFAANATLHTEYSYTTG